MNDETDLDRKGLTHSDRQEQQAPERWSIPAETPPTRSPDGQFVRWSDYEALQRAYSAVVQQYRDHESESRLQKEASEKVMHALEARLLAQVQRAEEAEVRRRPKIRETHR